MKWFVLVLVIVVVFSGCATQQNKEDKLPSLEKAPYFSYSVLNFTDGFVEFINFLDGGNSIVVNRRGNETSKGVGKLLIFPKIPEIGMDLNPLVAKSEQKLKPIDSTAQFRLGVYYIPQLSKLYFNRDAPTVETVFYGKEKAYSIVYTIPEMEGISFEETNLEKNNIICKTIPYFQYLGKCAFAFNRQPGSSITQILGTDQWAEAIEWLKANKLEGKVLTWWDFSSVIAAIGETDVFPNANSFGQISNTSQFLAADTFSWDKYKPWLKSNNITHILVDASMIGKLPSIQAIQGNIAPDAIINFGNPKKQQPVKEGVFIEYEGTASVLQLIMDNNSNFVRAPVISHLNGLTVFNVTDICTERGLKVFNNTRNPAPGCLYRSGLGTLYLPTQIETTIFTDLMLMGGSRSPVEKVFSNKLIKIYKVKD